MRSVALVTVAVCLISPAAAFAQRVEVTETEIVELRNAAVANMNERGVIVGSKYNGTFSVPMRWTEKRGIEFFLGQVDGQATAVNDRGVIVGTVTRAEDGLPEGFIWSRRDGVRLLGLFVPFAINNKDLVVGACAPDGDFGQAHPCVWENGRFTDINTSGVASDVNERGAVVGQTYTPESGFSAFVWSREDGLTILPKGDDPSLISSADGINDKGEIAGFLYDGNGDNYRPARWTAAGELVLPDVAPGATLLLMNDKSLAVGRYSDASGLVAFALTSAGSVIRLGNGAPLALTDRNVVLGLLETNAELRTFLWRIRGARQAR